MGWQPSPGGNASDAAPAPVRDPRLTGFARGGEWDRCRPSAELAAVLESVSGPGWRAPGATRDELLGMLRQAQALESRAAAAKLGILRSLIRDDDQLRPGGGYYGDLPDGWTKSLTHEAALALSMPAVSADNLMEVAWDLEARLPGIGDLLTAGSLTYPKAKVVCEAFLLLSDENAAAAEAMILAELPGKTYGQVKRLAEQASITVDPESTARRREHAERNNARVTLSREDSGAIALSGRDLPSDQALAANTRICARAQQYKDSGAFPVGAGMDQFRAAAFLDMLNGKPAEARIASGQLVTVTRAAPAGTTDAGEQDTGKEAARRPAAEEPPGNSDPDDGDPGDAGGPGNGDRPGGSPDSLGPLPAPDGGPPPRYLDLVLPLATLLRLAERPGESHGLGPLDPELCRELAVAAITSPWTRLCVTVTDSGGIAIGHGCGKPPRNAKGSSSGRPPRDPGTGTALPAQVNLTITAARLTELANVVAARPPGTSDVPWSFTPVGDSGPPGGFGAWVLTLPGGRQLTVALEPMPIFGCDHRLESHAYQPSDRLRHLVQVRDYTCTFPVCNRHARDSDFEHGVPYDKGGRTCACNAGARSRACHQVKQSPGWKVTQPRPGWHEWSTPAGRTYVQPPKRYPT